MTIHQFIHVIQHHTQECGMQEPEIIEHGTSRFAILIHPTYAPPESSFMTDPEDTLQVGHIVYPAGGEVQRHRHVPIPRHVENTQEVILVRRGCCCVDFYGEGSQPVCTRELHEGDVLVLLEGGHGFRMQSDTILLEIKQGPYVGQTEKVRF